MDTNADDVQAVLPNHTVYINNLNEKVRKDGMYWFLLGHYGCITFLLELKRNLYALFCQYGPILELICVKALKMKGQAFIVYHHLKSAELAIQHLDGVNFYDKPMVYSQIW